MKTFAQAVQQQPLKGKTITDNGMPTRISSKSHCLDYFYKVGSSRAVSDTEHLNMFLSAFTENADLAIRTLLWARDARNGAGERKHFRLVYKHLAVHNIDIAKRILARIVDLGRWDDVFEGFFTPLHHDTLALITKGIESGDKLLFKWLPREKSAKRVYASIIRKHLGLKPKQYRKLLSTNTTVVESQMCAHEWSNINYSHVPSQASRIYSSTFLRHDEVRYRKFLSDAVEGTNDAKVNAGAIYPHQILTDLNRMFVQAQWNNLPNYFTKPTKVLPMIDVSYSMTTPSGDPKYSCMDVAIALGLYTAEKQTGPFKDVYLTFESTPKICVAQGDVVQKYNTIKQSSWGGSTSIERAFKAILKLATKNKIPQSEMPEYLLIFSDMQFDAAVDNPSLPALKLVKQLYKNAGYELPKIVFWNLANRTHNTPASKNNSNVALVSGFSPSLMTSLFADIENYTPMNVMLKTINQERYNY